MNKAVAVLRLTRIEHSAMLVVAVIAAELLAGGLPGYLALAMSLAAPILISMGSFALNDYFDVEVDRLNKRHDRPLVSGSLEPPMAAFIAALSFAIGVAASALINKYAFLIALVFALLAIAYSYRLKEFLLVGNAYIALSMAIPFIFGNYVVSAALAPAIAPICMMVFLSGLGREVQGTIRDYAGDVKIRNARTLPKVIGTKSAAWVALALYVVAIIISAYLFVFIASFRSNLLYGAMVLVSDALLFYYGVGYLRSETERFYGRARNASLAAMALAIFAILLAPVIYV
jgi:geranylgeranylglycerol-phosphate geranylgeranyltransferase